MVTLNRLSKRGHSDSVLSVLCEVNLNNSESPPLLCRIL